MTTTNSVLKPLTLTKEEVIETLLEDPKTSDFGRFSIFRAIVALNYMDKNFSDEEQDAVFKEVANNRKKDK